MSRRVSFDERAERKIWRLGQENEEMASGGNQPRLGPNAERTTTSSNEMGDQKRKEIGEGLSTVALLQRKVQRGAQWSEERDPSSLILILIFISHVIHFPFPFPFPSPSNTLLLILQLLLTNIHINVDPTQTEP
jgi:CRISPR/Cas system CMR subunit Cmr4 (Cas7 group RAMP superfamily)